MAQKSPPGTAEPRTATTRPVTRSPTFRAAPLSCTLALSSSKTRESEASENLVLPSINSKPRSCKVHSALYPLVGFAIGYLHYGNYGNHFWLCQISLCTSLIPVIGSLQACCTYEYDVRVKSGRQSPIVSLKTFDEEYVITTTPAP